MSSSGALGYLSNYLALETPHNSLSVYKYVCKKNKDWFSDLKQKTGLWPTRKYSLLDRPCQTDPSNRE